MNVRNCPYLGLEFDPTTYHAYPSGDNFCHKARQSGMVDLEYQATTCLSTNHTRCPIYTGEIDQFAESHKSPLLAGAGKKGIGFILLGGLAVLILGVILVFQGTDGIGAFFQSSSSATPSPTVTVLLENKSLLVPSLTPTKPSLSFPLVLREPTVTPLPTLTFTPSPTVTNTPTSTVQASPRATQSRWQILPTQKPVKPTKTAAPPEPPAFRPTATP